MKKILLLLLLLVQVFYLFAQIDLTDSSVFTKPDWKVGEKFKYSCSYVSKSILLAKEENSTQTYNLDITILQDDGDSYIIEIYKYNTLHDGEKKDFRKSFDYEDGLKINVRISKNGIPLEITNHKQVQKHLQQKHNQTTAYWNAYPQMEPIFKEMAKLYDTKEHIEHVYLKNGWIYDVFYLYDEKYYINTPISKKDNLLEKNIELISLSSKSYNILESFINALNEKTQIAIEFETNGFLNKYVRIGEDENSINTTTFKKIN